MSDWSSKVSKFQTLQELSKAISEYFSAFYVKTLVKSLQKVISTVFPVDRGNFWKAINAKLAPRVSSASTNLSQLPVKQDTILVTLMSSVSPVHQVIFVLQQILSQKSARKVLPVI